MNEPRWTPQEAARASKLDLGPHLEATGWALAELRDRYAVWTRLNEGETLRIVVPSSPVDEDFATRMLEGLLVIAYAEGRTLAEVLTDVESGGADIISVRIDPGTPSGQAPLDVAERAVTALKDFVVGSAGGLEVAGAVLPPRRPRAERYAGRARLTTRAGSFILTVAMPLYEGRPNADTVTGQTAMDEVVEVPAVPFGRQVASRMKAISQSAARLAHEVREGRDDVTAFDTDPAVTGNATELAALAQLGGGLAQDYRIRFTQSPVIRSATPEPSVVTVGPREQEILGQAADLLRELKPKDDVSVVGTIVGLSREEGLGPGQVVIKGVELESGRAHRYRVLLSEDQYHQAIAAHERGLQVSARGSLVIRGTFLILEAIRWFYVQLDLPEPTQDMH